MSADATKLEDDSFRELTDPYRRELQVHCYRLLGSHQDAEEMLQETLLAAWRGLDRFEGERDGLRPWLYRIATNRCLNALRDQRRRPRPAPPAPPHFPAPTRSGEPLWLGPYPDSLLEGIPETAPGPEARYETKEAVTLAFVAALQRLPQQQRAVLVLRDVLGFRAAEAAEMLETSEAAVNSALQRARATVEARTPVRRDARTPHSPEQREVAARFAEAVESGDVEAMVSLLTDEALLTMPPLPLEYEGRNAIHAFLSSGEEHRGASLRLVPTRANGLPAFGAYTPVPGETGEARPSGLFALTLQDEEISAITWFADVSVFPGFGLPPMLGGGQE
jgi:RNA polymerase sigma-70 factor (ECF subfamily)